MPIGRDLPGPGRVGLSVKSLRQLTTDLIGRDFGLRVCARTPCVRTCEVGIHSVDGVELPIPADMIVMGMRVQHNDRQPRQLCGDLPDVTNSHAGVKEQGLFVADDQVADGLFGLMRLIESETAGATSKTSNQESLTGTRCRLL